MQPLYEGIEVRVDPARQGLGVFARVLFAPGDRIGYFTGEPSPVRSRMSLQFGPDLFIEPGPLDPLRNLNHACDPSAIFVGRDLIARHLLQPGEPVTIDYNLHEPELASPFECQCGAEACVGEVKGWRFLCEDEKRLRRPMAGSWLSQNA